MFGSPIMFPPDLEENGNIWLLVDSPLLPHLFSFLSPSPCRKHFATLPEARLKQGGFGFLIPLNEQSPVRFGGMPAL